MTLPLRWPPDAARPLAPLRSTGRNASASHPSSTNAARPAAPPATAATPSLRTPKATALSENDTHILALMGNCGARPSLPHAGQERNHSALDADYDEFEQ